MRAFTIDAIGDRGRVSDVPVPALRDGEVLVRVEAAAVVASDWRVRTGSRMGRQEHVFPAILGHDFAGTIADVGRHANGWNIGDRVIGCANKPDIGAGCFAEYVAMPGDSAMARLPPDLSAAQGAALVSGWLTATAAIDMLTLQPGDVVVVIGASGGVGSILLQLLARAGARVVAVTRAANDDYVRGLGAAEAIDYTRGDARYPHDVDALVDLYSGRDALLALGAMVKPGGTILSAVHAADAEAIAAMGRRGDNIRTMPTAERLKRLAGALSDGLAPPHIELLGLDDAAGAIDRAQNGHVRGRIVIEIA